MSGDGKLPWWAWGCAGSTTRADLRNLGRFNLMCLAWGAALTLVTAAIRYEWLASATVVWTLTAGAALLGLAPLAAYRRYLREADELQRRIQLEGIALGYGGGLIFAIGYLLFEPLGAPELGVDNVVLVFILLWVVGQLAAARRYR